MDTWVCVGMQGVHKCARLCGSMCIVCGLGISNNGIVSFRAYQNDHFHNEIATFALFMLIMMYICHYKKDPYRKDWARREATILVLEREEAGLPYIDMNYVDPKKLLENLPTEEELEGTQVYI